MKPKNIFSALFRLSRVRLVRALFQGRGAGEILFLIFRNSLLYIQLISMGILAGERPGFRVSPQRTKFHNIGIIMHIRAQGKESLPISIRFFCDP
jgi:hypothetical protein